MNTYELMTDFLIEDFHEGDRVYFHIGRTVHAATVTGILAPFVLVRTDGGEHDRIHLDDFNSDEVGSIMREAGRLLPMEEIKPGVILSRLRADGKRDCLKVIAYTPNRSITVEYPDPDHEETVTGSKLRPLDLQFPDWELEP